jgi:hypothetical protein
MPGSAVAITFIALVANISKQILHKLEAGANDGEGLAMKSLFVTGKYR